jgi:2'-5' RNA ligase
LVANPMTPRNLERITSDYERMWADSSARLRIGDIQPDPVPGDGSRRWGVSAVIRPLGRVQSRLAEAADELKALAGDRQVVYGPTNLHTTVRSIEFHRIDVGEHDEKVSEYRQALQKILRDFGPIPITYRGLTSDGTSIMAQGWPADDTLQLVREAFHAELGRRALLGGPERSSVRQTSHASLIVFTHPLCHAEKLADHVRDNRTTDYGRCDITDVELVRYRRSESDVRLDVFASVPARR